MAQTYKVSGINLNTTDTYSGFYTCPVSGTAIINSVYIGNTGATDDAVTLRVYDNSVNKNYQLLTSGLVPLQAALQPFSAPLILESGDSLSGKAATGYLEVVVNVLEIT